MKFIFKILAFSIMLNFATGIMYAAIPELALFGNSGITYESDYASGFSTTMGGDLNPTGDLEDKSSAFDRLLDKIGLGVFTKIVSTIDQYMFGFIKILEGVFGSLMTTSLSSMVFGSLRVIVGIAYTLGLIWLFTGKNIVTGEN